jgi:hypothetical protein
MASASYRLLTASGAATEDGDADVEVADGALVVSPSGGAVLRVPFAQISSVGEGQPYTLEVGLAGGQVIELSRLGAMRTQLLAELRDARGAATASAAGAVGQAEPFSATCGSDQVEVRVYEDALLILRDAASERISFSFVTGVRSADYVVTLEVAGRDPLALSRLGRRTGELASLLTDRLAKARGRTAAFLSALLPGLDAMALRQAAGLLRDGVAAPASTLRSIHPDLFTTLTQVAALPARQPIVADLARRTDLAIGFKQVTSVHRAAVGATPWHDHAAAPHIGEHENPGGSFAPGLRGMMAAGIMSGGPPVGPGFGGAGFAGGSFGGGPFGFGEGYGEFGDYWAYRALGAGMNAATPRQMSTRPNVERGRLTPATEDFAALTVSGQDPTVLAFLLGRVDEFVVFEVLNSDEHSTYLYRAADPDGFTAVNRALDDCGFAVSAVHAQGLRSPTAAATPSAAFLIGALATAIPHGPQWQSRIADALGRREP